MIHGSCLTSSRGWLPTGLEALRPGLPARRGYPARLREAGDLAQADREGRLARSAGPDDDHSLHSCLWCLRLVAEISPGPCAARLSAVVNVIGPVVTGVAIVTAVEHSAGERARAELGRLRKDR